MRYGRDIIKTQSLQNEQQHKQHKEKQKVSKMLPTMNDNDDCVVYIVISFEKTSFKTPPILPLDRE